MRRMWSAAGSGSGFLTWGTLYSWGVEVRPLQASAINASLQTWSSMRIKMMCGWFLFAPGSSLGAFVSPSLGLGCWADRKSRLKRRIHRTTAAGRGCMLGAGTLQRSTTTGNNAEKLDTSREEKCPGSAQILAGNNYGSENHSGAEPASLAATACWSTSIWRRDAQSFCFLTFSSLCSSDAPTSRASARSARRGQTFQNVPDTQPSELLLDFITPQFSFPGPSVSAEVKTRGRLRNCCFFSLISNLGWILSQVMSPTDKNFHFLKHFFPTFKIFWQFCMISLKMKNNI